MSTKHKKPGCRAAFAVAIYLLFFPAIRFVSAAPVQTRQVSVSLEPALPGPARPFPSLSRPGAQALAVLKQEVVPGPPPVQRNPELSEDQLVVIALDPRGVEIARVLVLDPRIIRAESVDEDGRFTASAVYYLSSAEFGVCFPDRPDLAAIRVCEPVWTGQGFWLKTIAQGRLPGLGQD